MKRTKKRATIISTKLHMKNKAVKLQKRDKKLITLTVLFTAGLLFGAMLIKSGKPECIGFVQSNLTENLEQIKANGFWENNLLSLKFQSLCMAALFFFGLSVLGEGLLWLFPLLQGTLLGIVSSFLYSRASVTGMTFFGIVLLLPAIFAVSSFLLACKESILTERDLNRSVFLKEQGKDGKTMLKLYSLRYAFFYLGNVFSSFLFALLCFLFRNKFNLSFLS